MTGEQGTLRYEKLSPEDKAAVDRYLTWVVEVQERSLADRHPTYGPRMESIREIDEKGNVLIKDQKAYKVMADDLLGELAKERSGTERPGTESLEEYIMRFIREHEPSIEHAKPHAEKVDQSRSGGLRSRNAQKSWHLRLEGTGSRGV